MQYIKRKTNVRRHDRQTKHKIADVRKHERNLKSRRMLGVIPLKSLTYPQAKAVFSSLEPYGDIDEDKVINKRDCRPFDVDRQDEEWDDFNREVREANKPTDEEIEEAFEAEEKEKFDYEKHTGFSRPFWGDED